MFEFFNQFESLLKTAFTGGIEAQPLSFRRFQQRNLTRKEVKRFYAGCHRGYDKAQNKIVEMLTDLQSDNGLAEEERLYRELLLRKTMDGIHALARKKLVVLMDFDIVGFIWLCNHVVGMETKFGTRREAAELAKEYGANNMVTWDGRALSIRTRDCWSTLFGGILSRFANDLSNPIAFMNCVMNSHFPESPEN